VNRNFAFSRVLTSFLLVLCMSQAGAQQSPAPLTVPDYKAGQVWTYKTAPGAEDSRIVILRLEPAGKKGRIIHVRVENLPLPSCGGFHLTTAIEHLAISEEALRHSTIQLENVRAELPDSYFDAYSRWAKDRHKEVTNKPIAELTLPPTAGLMICNYRGAE
jgi:hypothetical protein